MNKVPYVSNIILPLFQSLFSLVESLEEADLKVPNDVQTGILENGYSVGAISLAVTILESAISRAKYIRKDNPRLNSVRYFRDLSSNDGLSAELDEAYAVRDAIVHNHLWEADVTWEEHNFTLVFASQPHLVEGYGNTRQSRVMNRETRLTRILQLNLFPTRIWRRDAYIIIGKIGEAMKILEKLDRNYIYFTHIHFRFKGNLFTFDQIYGQLTIPD